MTSNVTLDIETGVAVLIIWRQRINRYEEAWRDAWYGSADTHSL